MHKVNFTVEICKHVTMFTFEVFFIIAIIMDSRRNEKYFTLSMTSNKSASTAKWFKIDTSDI